MMVRNVISGCQLVKVISARSLFHKIFSGGEMRFFGPRLSQVSTIHYAPISYDLPSNALLKSIWISGDLTQFSLHCRPSLTKKNQQKIQNSIEAELSAFPFFVSRQFKNNVLHMQGLIDIQFAFARNMDALQKEDPLFFDELNCYLNELESDELGDANPVGSMHDLLKNSQLRTRYCSLQSLRQDGMQHAIEFPLKGLEKHKLITQTQLNTIILQVWLRVNLLRNRQSEDLTKKLSTPAFVPYVFSRR